MSLRLATIAMIAVAAFAGCNRSGSAEDDMFADAEADGVSAGMCGGDASLQQAMIDAANQERGSQQKSILEADEKLNLIAQAHACDIVGQGQPSVTGSDGTNIVDRARSAGFPTCGVAQLVAVGGSAEAVARRWAVSMPHRAELLGQVSDKIGAGAARGPDGRIWWSLVLGDDCR
ncbi:CAP domain-containing protein [Paracoccus sp. 11-3]|uniref:CAP domain-containing protein n=1 Tax=Paracoccus amoyensis TaxID=2760093 RepID=A0A926GHD1_9RHOB|nr:CAP domain-containing protein [Paracoccus amoyensis]MBC9247047.1 CAP domain-containing protein [Paracoccus amoyensis]